MKRNLVLAAVVLLLPIAAVSVSAQTRPAPTPTPAARPATPQPVPSANVAVPVTKIAFVDTTEFGVDKTGITRYTNAVKSVQSSFQPRTKELFDIQTRMKAISDELKKLSESSAAPVVGPQAIQAKQDEGERLERDFKYKKEQLDADFGKKYNEVVAPISADIGRALDRYATQNGITIILDVSKLLPAVLSAHPGTDVTKAFIADYNSKNP